MDYIEIKNIKSELNELIYDCVTTLEEDRFFPSVREAGSAPRDTAVASVSKMITDFISKNNKKDFNKINEELNIDSIIQYINSNQDKSVAENVTELKEIDTFLDGEHDEKRYYRNTIYQYVNDPDVYLRVTETLGRVGYDDHIIESIECSITQKKQIVSYEWL